MDPERHQRISALFQAVCDLPPEAREVRLDEECAGDASLRAEVETLLDRDDSDDDALSETSMRLGAHFHLAADPAGRSVAEPAGSVPDHIGAYRILGVLGRGGMGMVYEAKHDELNRHVAVKVLKSDGASPEMLRRFRAEAQVLGQLSHPGIARIYDTGTFDRGDGARPWFAMELVQGEPVTGWAKRCHLDVPGRVRLMIDVCNAVQHAHQKGVVHRDLKPDNILVDDSGQVRVLDFGVARVLDSDLQVTTLHTHAGQLIGTVPYMSPEQVIGDASLIDARCDVYALGVLLFELLAGRLPYDLHDKSVPEAARIIRDDEPSSLSTVNRACRGDLDTIVAKALEKDLERRYQTAQELAGDLRRHLRDEPIEARPPSTIYQLRKFARRNRGLVGAAAVAFLVLVAGVVGTSIGLVRAVHARGVAESNEQKAAAELARAESVTGFLRDLLAGSSPWVAAGRDTELLRQILDDAAANIGDSLEDQPEAEIQIRNTIGSSYRMIGDPDQASTHIERARELTEQHLDPDDPIAFETRDNLAWLHLDRGEDEAARVLFEDNHRRHQALLGSRHPDTINDLIGLLRVHRYRYEWAEEIAETDALLDEGDGAPNLEFLAWQRLFTERADALSRMGRYDEAGDLYRRLLEQQRRQYGDRHPYTMGSIRGLASILRRVNRLDEARPLYEENLEHCRAVFGESNQMTASAKNSLALLYRDQGRYDDAARLLEEVLELNRRELGPSHQYTLITMYNLAGVYGMNGRHDEAERVMRERLEAHREHFGPEHKQTLLAQANLAMQQLGAGHVDAALDLYEDAISTARRVKGFDRSFLGYFLLLYGQALSNAQRYPDAEAPLLESWDLLVEAFTTDHDQSRNAALSLLALYERWGKPEQARRWRSTAIEIGAELPDNSDAGEDR